MIDKENHQEGIIIDKEHENQTLMAALHLFWNQVLQRKVALEDFSLDCSSQTRTPWKSIHFMRV